MIEPYIDYDKFDYAGTRIKIFLISEKYIEYLKWTQNLINKNLDIQNLDHWYTYRPAQPRDIVSLQGIPFYLKIGECKRGETVSLIKACEAKGLKELTDNDLLDIWSKYKNKRGILRLATKWNTKVFSLRV